MEAESDSPDMIGPEGNLQLSQDLSGFLHASLKLTTHQHLFLNCFVQNLTSTMKKMSRLKSSDLL